MNKMKQASLLSCEEWANSFEKGNYFFEYSYSFKKKEKRLISKMRDDKLHKLTKNTTRALLIAAVILLMTVTAFAIPKSREYIVKKFFNHSMYSVSTSSDYEKVKSLEVSYVPKGFERTREQDAKSYESDISFVYEYTKGTKFFHIEKSTLDSEINYDTENYSGEMITINGIEAVYYQTNDNTSGVIFNNGQYVYTLDGNIEKKELVKIAQNIK